MDEQTDRTAVKQRGLLKLTSIILLSLQLISPYAVAVYGGLCALASFDRQDIHSKVLTSRLVCEVPSSHVFQSAPEISQMSNAIWLPFHIMVMIVCSDNVIT